MSRPALLPALVTLTLLTACSSPSAAPSSPAATAATAGSGGIAFDALDVTPTPHDEAAIAAAADAASAAALLDPVPPAVDFQKQLVLCIYLGERTGKWGFSVGALNIEAGALHVAAAERAPRAGDTATTHPAQCLAVDRSGLPAGELTVTADDTVSDEFIVEGTISVPPAENAP